MNMSGPSFCALKVHGMDFGVERVHGVAANRFPRAKSLCEQSRSSSSQHIFQLSIGENRR
jgi:hypothetical protein